MSRKLFLSSSIFLLATASAHAGLYAGAGLGPDTVNFKQNARISQAGNFDVLDKTHLSGTGLYGTLFAGYGKLIYKQLYLAAELNGNISSVDFKSSNHDYVHSSYSQTNYKINNMFGVSVLPGYQYSPDTLFYARLGYANGQLKVRSTDVSIGNASHRQNGFRYGVGMNQALNARWSVRMDYSRVDYSDITLRTFDALSSTPKSTIVTPFQQLLEFGVVYRFDAVSVSTEK